MAASDQHDADTLRTHVLDLLDMKGAHAPFARAVEEMPMDKRGRRPDGLPYSPWELVEHMRIAQHDILDFCRNADYEQPNWPDDYWPGAATPPNDEAWNGSIRQFQDDLNRLRDLFSDPDLDLYAEIPYGSGQTYLREALLVADHNAYHTGQLITVRRLLDAWPPKTEDAAKAS